MTWLNDKIEKCNHAFDVDDMTMGSVGGMFGMTFEDGSNRKPMVFVECYKCGYAYVSYELMGHQSLTKAEKETFDLINSFHNMRYDRKNENKTQ